LPQGHRAAGRAARAAYPVAVEEAAVRVVCSYCRKDMGRRPPLNDGGLTHAMCPACDEYFGRQWAGMSLAEYLDRFSFPVMLMEAEGRVVAANQAAGAMLDRDPAGMAGLLGGEALECVHARLPEGCGHTTHCATCAIRNAVTRTHRTGQPLTRVPARLKGRKGSADLLISTALEGKLVRVTVEPAGQVARPSSP
jgi:PAS domain-containing protein